MDLLPLNQNYLSKGHGLANLGNSCYLNSIMQCILSCPAIFEELDKNSHKNHIKNNTFAQHLIELSKSALSGENIMEKGVVIWRDIINISNNRKDKYKILAGAQEDAHEGLMLFLDSLDRIPEIKRLFMHRHRIQITCDVCKKRVVDKYEENCVFEVQPDLKTEQHEKFKDIDEYFNRPMSLNEFLRKQNGYVDEDFTCPNEACKAKGHKFKTTSITMLPEILPIVLKKYDRKVLTPFPHTLEFVVLGGKKKMVYQLTAQCEHAGSTMGGHYWAVCLRADGWKTLNDSSVSSGQSGPTPNTYILFYNFIRYEDVNAIEA